MVDSVTIVDKNGNGIIAEGISRLAINSTNKEYVLYTLNEKVENDLTKMYVGEIGQTVGSLGQISPEEWKIVSDTLRTISHGEPVNGVEFKAVSGLTFNIGDPKKLAIKADVKQRFKDTQLTATLAVNQGANPNVSAMPGESSFFNAGAIADTTSDEPAIHVNDVPNIFQNPMQPENYTAAQEEPAMPSEVVENVPQTVIEPVVVNTQVSTVPQAVTEPAMEPEVITTTQEVATSSLGTETTLTENSEKEVSKEEAMQALEVLNRYFKYNKILPSELATEVNMVIEQPKVVPAETIVVPTMEQSPVVEETPVVSEPAISTASTDMGTYSEIDVATPVTTFINTSAENLSQELPQGEVPVAETPVVFETPVIPEPTIVESVMSEPTIVPSFDTVPSSPMPEVVPSTENTNFVQDLPPIMETIPDNVVPFEAPAVEPQNGYVATTSTSAVQFANQEPAPEQIPVVMPDGYAEVMAMNQGMNGMGPATLTADPAQTLVKTA